MEEVATLIVELLKTHNRVSLPGLGAFMAAPKAAAINREAQTIAPPAKKITFSKAETWDDGLLEQLYAERHSLSPDEARDRLRHLIVDIRFELDATGKVTLPGLGTLRQSPSREIDFGLSKILNLKSDSYGLGEVKIAADEKGVFSMRRERRAPSDAPSGGGAPLLILLGVMVVIISALLLYFFLNFRHSDDWMLPTAQEDAPLPPPATATTPAPAPPPAPAPAATPPLPEPQRIVHTPQPPPKTPAPAPAPRCEYCVVGTSLSTQQGAALKAETYRKMGYTSGVVNSGNNHYRVTLGCFRNREVAEQERSEIRKFIRDAWILEVCR